MQWTQPLKMKFLNSKFYLPPNHGWLQFLESSLMLSKFSDANLDKFSNNHAKNEVK